MGILSNAAAMALMSVLVLASPTLLSQSLGNGEGAAGGPPSEIYFRLDPNYRCSAGAAGGTAPGYRRSLMMGLGAPSMTLHDSCTGQDTPLTSTEAREISGPREYFRGNRFLVFRGEIYEKAPPFQSSPSDSRVFGWCTSQRDPSHGRVGAFGSDVVLYRGAGGTDLRAELYFADPVAPVGSVASDEPLNGSSPPPQWREVKWIHPFAVQSSGCGYFQDSFKLDLSQRPDGLSALWANVDGQDRSDLVSCIFNP